MALSKLSSKLFLPNIPVKPVYPPTTFNFPKRSFGKKKVVQRSCRAEWFSTWPWLHYRTSDDVVLCHVCITAMKNKGMEKGNSDSSFLFAGFKNWKDGTVAFKDHQSSATHKTALQLVVDIPSSYADVGEMLSSEYAQEKSNNKQCLLKILSNVAFLARQGFAFRGDGDEVNSNFVQLLQLRGLDDPRINDWVSKKTNKYTSHDIQDELLKAMALNLLRKIAANLVDTRFFASCV